MEKEKKGLFGQLLAFWKEKIGMGGTESIGFWYEKEPLENHFSEMGAVVVLSQKETRKAFWEETEAILQEKEKTSVLMKENRKTEKIPEKEDHTEAKRGSTIFAAEIFREKRKAEAEEPEIGRAFLWDMPEEEREKRRIVPVMDKAVQKEGLPVEEEKELPKQEGKKREETQAEPVIDIERLMRQMTKKLWEEREGSGRRLR